MFSKYASKYGSQAKDFAKGMSSQMYGDASRAYDQAKAKYGPQVQEMYGKMRNDASKYGSQIKDSYKQMTPMRARSRSRGRARSRSRQRSRSRKGGASRKRSRKRSRSRSRSRSRH